MRIGPVPPVLASADWGALIESLARSPRGAVLSGAAKSVAMGVLAAPVAVARWIAERAPSLAGRSPLRLLVVGAEKLDAVDGGRWYSLIPALLGAEGRIEPTLIGERLHMGFDSPLRHAAPERAAQCFVGTLATYLRSSPELAADLAFVFHPGFQKHRGWLRDSSLAKLVATGIPVVAASYEADEYEMDRWVVECHGFSVTGALVLNPLYVDLGDASTEVRWGRALWRFAPAAPTPGSGVDNDRLAALDRLGEMVMHSMARRQAPRAPYGARVELRGSDGSVRRLIYLFDDFLADPDDGRVMTLSGGQPARPARLSASDLERYPGARGSDLQRAIWAADMKRSYLLGPYPEAHADTSARGLARAMHADLENRVERLFSQERA